LIPVLNVDLIESSSQVRHSHANSNAVRERTLLYKLTRTYVRFGGAALEHIEVPKGTIATGVVPQEGLLEPAKAIFGSAARLGTEPPRDGNAAAAKTQGAEGGAGDGTIGRISRHDRIKSFDVLDEEASKLSAFGDVGVIPGGIVQDGRRVGPVRPGALIQVEALGGIAAAAGGDGGVGLTQASEPRKGVACHVLEETRMVGDFCPRKP